MGFEFATAGRIVFGAGALSILGEAARDLGARALVVTGANPQRAAPACERLDAAGVGVERFAVESEPTLDVVEAGVDLARAAGCDLVVSFGGGSAIDTGKAIAALAPNPGRVLRYLEVIGEGAPLAHDPLPQVAVPTTAGTGAEVTKNAVVASPEHRVKVSMRADAMLPKLALVDPELTYSVPPAVTAATGLDALTQVIEPFVSQRANPLTDSLCRDAIARAAGALPRAFRDGGDTQARTDMALVSLFGGLALANAKLGAVHGFAGPIGGRHPAAPHGAVCGRLLPLVMETNVRALRERAPSHPSLGRYREIAALLTGRAEATVDDGVAWLAALGEELDVPGLASYGLRSEDRGELVEAAARASSMKGNPIELTVDELADILARAA
jgi:alcohol dehydrogenase class IV